MLNKYFEPYSEFTLRTTLSEEALRAALKKACGFFAALKKSFTLGTSGTVPLHLIRSKEEVVLRPFCRGRNSLRGNVHVTMRKDPHSPETILYVAIRPPDVRWHCVLWLGFLLLWTVIALCLGQWIPLLPVPVMAGFFFLVMHVCRYFAEGEIPQIKHSFEELIRQLENEKGHDTGGCAANSHFFSNF